jgi:hypothetical protein
MTTTEAHRRYPPAIAPPQTSALPLALNRRNWLNSLQLFVVAALLLLAADVALLRLHSGAYIVPIGNYRDKLFLERANYQESTPDDTTYRWTTGNSILRLNQLGNTRHASLTLDLGGRPEAGELDLTLNGQPWVRVIATTEPRHYRLLLPPNLPQDLAIGLNSPTFTVPGDSRKLGVKIEGFALTLERDSAPLPIPAQYFAQLAIVLAALLSAIRLNWRLRAQALLLLPLALALAALLSGQLLLTYAYLPQLAIAALGLAALTWLVLPLAERYAATDDRMGVREIRLLWALMLGACALRLSGVLYPTFSGQDLGLNLGRLFKTITGQLIVIASSSEFANGRTIYPPGPYLTVMPSAILSADYGLLLQSILATLDGATAFLIALAARRLGGNRDAGRFALLLYAVSIPAFAVLQFGFSAQVFGQWFTAPLLLLLLGSARPPQPRTWLLATLLLLFGMFSHIGVAILGVAWMGFALLLTLLHDRRSALWGMGMMTAGGLLALGLLYVDIAAFTLSHAGNAVATRSESGLVGATPLLLKGTLLAYTEVGLALLPLGLLLICWRRAGWGRKVAPPALLLSALLFFAVDVAWAMQVRYFYFALPLVLPAIGIVLGRIAARGQWARRVSWALVLLLLLQGALAWAGAAFGEVQISMTPLTH